MPPLPIAYSEMGNLLAAAPRTGDYPLRYSHDFTVPDEGWDNPGMDPQTVEIIGRNYLVSMLVSDGLEVARPERDRGVDLIAYLDLDEVGRFVACPIQMKAATTASFSLHYKYERIAPRSPKGVLQSRRTSWLGRASARRLARAGADVNTAVRRRRQRAWPVMGMSRT